MQNSERLTVDAKPLFRLLGVTKNTGYAALRRGTFPLKPIYCGKRILFSKVEVEQLLGASAVKPAETKEQTSG